jgi:hypothetical protein
LASLLGHHTPSPVKKATNLLNLNDNLRFLVLAEEVRSYLVLRDLLLVGTSQLCSVLRQYSEGSLLAKNIIISL